jgi:hypothetical protein
MIMMNMRLKSLKDVHSEQEIPKILSNPEARIREIQGRAGLKVKINTRIIETAM